MKVIWDMYNKKHNQCCQAPNKYGILISYKLPTTLWQAG
jgi:hypothetical protein